ncbi:cysteine-rich CWC family protein [Endozoicomonas sp. SCSIO W0465]|uniref:cysteine-rich CWC family protein n=1 Tax=Endozoicomonas sp. SCSIO W0465 TaxID=2918516 RepID=UPI0035319C6C
MTEVNSCPQCGQPNQCAYAKGKPSESCWCMQSLAPESKVETPVLLPIPKEKTSCYCARCLEKVKKESGCAQSGAG